MEACPSESTPLLSTHAAGGSSNGLRSTKKGARGTGLLPNRSMSSFTDAETSTQPFCGSANNMCDACWPKIFSVVIAAGLGGLLFGYDSSDIAIALPVRGCNLGLLNPTVRAPRQLFAVPPSHRRL